MEVEGKNNWICIPDENEEYDEPVFVPKGTVLTSNYDTVLSKKNLSAKHIDRATEREIYDELAIPYKYLINQKAENLLLRAKELGVDAILETVNNRKILKEKKL